MAATVQTPDLTAPNIPPSSSPFQSPYQKLEMDVIAWTERLYELATEDRDRQKEVRDTFRTIEYLEGRQWHSQARYARNRPVLNKMRRHFWENVGLLTDLALDFQVKLYDKLNDFSQMEQLLNKLILHWAQTNQFEDRNYDVVLYGLLHSGPAKIQWNSALAGGMGDVQMLPIAPWQWATIGAGTDPQESECILYFPVVTKEHLVRRFGRVALDVECDMEYSGSSLQGQFTRPRHITPEAWARMGKTLHVSLGVRPSATASDSPYGMLMQKELWFRDASINESSRTVTVGPHDKSTGEPRVNWAYRVEPGMPLYPRGRVVVQAGGRVLEDQPSPYWHSMFPFPVFRPFRLPWSMSGQQLMKSWMQMNNIVNRIMGGMQDYLQGVIEPTLIAPKGAMPAADWDSLDPGAAGGKIKYNNNAPKAPEFAKKAEFPLAATFQYLNEINKEFDVQSGASAIQQALGKKQVPGSDSLETIMSSRSLPVRVESRSLASFLEQAGLMVISNMLQFYSVGHRVAIVGGEGITPSDYRPIYGEAIPSGMKPEDFVRKFSGVVRRDTLLNSQKESKQQLALYLRKSGDLSAKNLFRILDSNFDFETNKKELIEEARLKILLAAAAGALQGKGKKK